jgi:biopolymer transport protein ExbD
MSAKRRRRHAAAAMRQKIVGTRETQEENVIPMINIIFLLLLYFMIVGNLQPDYSVVPPLSTQMAEPSAQIPTLSVSADGDMRFENRVVTWDQFKSEITKFTGHEKLKIHADAKVTALTVSEIMKVATEAGILQFVLVTQRRVESAS